MANDRIETALASALEELEWIKRNSNDQTKAISSIGNEIKTIEKEIKEVKEKLPTILSKTYFDLVVGKERERVIKAVEAQPKNVVHQRRILLFPEWGAKEYYKTVLGRLCLGVVSVIIATFLFLLCKEFIQNWSDNRSSERELNAYKNAWQRLYKQSNMQERKKMDDIANGK